MNGRREGQTDGRTDGRTEGQTDGRTYNIQDHSSVQQLGDALTTDSPAQRQARIAPRVDPALHPQASAVRGAATTGRRAGTAARAATCWFAGE